MAKIKDEFSVSLQYYYTTGNEIYHTFLKERNLNKEDLINANLEQMMYKDRSVDITFNDNNKIKVIESTSRNNGSIKVKQLQNLTDSRFIAETSTDYKYLLNMCDNSTFDLLSTAQVDYIICNATYGAYYKVLSKSITKDTTHNIKIKLPGSDEYYTPILNDLTLTTVTVSKQEQMTVADYLRGLKPTSMFAPGIKIMLPQTVSGNTDSDTELNFTKPAWIDDLSTGSTKSSRTNNGSTVVAVGTAPITPDYSTYTGPQDCFFTIYERGQIVAFRYIPIYPEEITDRNSASYSATSILGRSVAYQTYNGSSRSVSLSLELHEELCDDYNYVPELVHIIESVTYPGYETGQVNPCEMELVIGDFLQIRGIVSGTTATWKAPIIDNRPVHCTIGFEITETTGPYSRAEVARMGAKRR